MNRWEHPTLVCPTHGKPLLVTRSGFVFCGEGLDEDRNPTCEVPAAVTIPKAVARAMRRLRKRTRRKLAKHAECTCTMGYKSGHGHSSACARFPYENFRYWNPKKRKARYG